MKIIENVLEKKKIVNSIDMGNVDISLHYVFLLLNIYQCNSDILFSISLRNGVIKENR